MNRIMAPSRPPQKRRFAGKKPQSPGSVSFGGRNGLVCLFPLVWLKYCHNGGTNFAPSSAAASSGVQQGRSRPLRWSA
jgi:hypothetical protein